MKKSTRLLSVLLAMVLCFTCFSVGVSAAYADYTHPAGYEHDKAFISMYQCGSIIADKIDALLAEKGKADSVNLVVTTLHYDITSIDAARNTVHTLTNEGIWKTAKSRIGTLGDLNFDAILAMPARSAAGRTDVEVLTGLLKFLYDNYEIVGMIVDGKLDNGILDNWPINIDINEKIGDVHKMIKDAAYNALFEDGKSSCTADSSLDTMVNELLYNLLIKSGKFLPSLEDELVAAGLMSAKGLANFNLNSQNFSVYNLLRCVLRAALKDYAEPVLLDVLGDNTEMLPLITGMLGMEISRDDFDSDAAYVDALVANLLDLKNGALSKFIRVTDDGISLTENFESLVNDLIQAAQGLMGNVKSFDTVSTWTADELAGLTKPQTLAYLVRTLLTGMIDYAVIPKTMPERKADGTVVEVPINGYGVATYMFICIMADKMPERNYMQMIENYKTNTGSEDQQLNPGQAPVLEKNSAGTVTKYVEPAAFTVLADYMYYFLNGKTTMNIPRGLSFDETLQFIVKWALGKFGGLVRTDNLNMTATPTLQNMVIWKNLDILLWENVFDITWLPDDYVSSFKDSNGNYTGNVTRTFLLDNLLYTLVDLDLSKLNNLLSIFNKYKGTITGYPETGEFDLNVIQFVLTLVKRLLNGLFQSDSALFAGTNINSLEDIVSKTEINGKTNLRILAENLSVLLSTKAIDPNDGQQKTYVDMILASALPLVASSLAKNEETARNFDVFPMNGETYTVAELRDILESQQPSRDLEADMMTDEDYFFFGSEDFDPLYKFYNYRKAYRDAQSFLNTYDRETEQIANGEITGYSYTQDELNTTAYRVGYYYGMLSLREADITQLKNEIDNAILRFGEGEYETAEAGDEFMSVQFTKKTWDAYTDALNFAQSIYRQYLYNGAGSVRQSKISAARELLILAEKALKFFSANADYSYLDRQITLALARLNASAADPDLYYAHTVTALLQAYNAALAVDRGYDGDDQNIIDEAAEALEDAILGLVNPPQIAKVEGKKTVLDKANHLIWGVAEKLSSYDAYIQALGDGIILYTKTANGYGTGTEAYLSVDGEKLQSYTVIVFGDIDGDSRADATDSNLVLAYCADLVNMNSNSFMAADADGDGEVDILDAYYLRQSGLSKYTVDQRGA